MIAKETATFLGCSPLYLVTQMNLRIPAVYFLSSLRMSWMQQLGGFFAVAVMFPSDVFHAYLGVKDSFNYHFHNRSVRNFEA